MIPEKIAKMQITWRRAVEGVMLAVMARCGAFLLAHIRAIELNRNFDLGV